MLLWLREPNNHSEFQAAGWRGLAKAVVVAYGHRYQRCVDYLLSLAENEFWASSELQALCWLETQQRAPSQGDPRYVMHESVLNAIAPSIPLRVVFSRNVGV